MVKRWSVGAVVALAVNWSDRELELYVETIAHALAASPQGIEQMRAGALAIRDHARSLVGSKVPPPSTDTPPSTDVPPSTRPAPPLPTIGSVLGSLTVPAVK